MTLDHFQVELNTSLKAGKAVRVLTLRNLISAVRNAAIAKYGASWEKSLTEADIADVIKKQIKTHKESIEAFQKANRNDLVSKEQAELDVLNEFAPKEVSDEELKKILAPVIAAQGTDLPAGRQNFGLLMKQAMAATSGKADGGRVAGILKQLLSSK